MGLMNRRRLVLAKSEVDYGVDPGPTALANAILINSFSKTPIEAVEVPREIIRPFFGNAQKLIASINSSIEIGVELAGSGTPGVAPGWDPLIKACSMAETVVADTSVTYKPISDPAAFKAVTIYLNEDGKLYKFTGAFGSFSLDMEIDKIPNFKFKFLGLFPAYRSMDKTIEMYEKILKSGPFSEVAPQAQINKDEFPASYAPNFSFDASLMPFGVPIPPPVAKSEDLAELWGTIHFALGSALALVIAALIVGSSIVMTVLLALLATWTGLAAAFAADWPIGFAVPTVAFAAYVAAQGLYRMRSA